MKLLNYKQFIIETNLMTAVSKGSQVDRIEFEPIDRDAFIDQDVNKYVVNGKDKEGKTIHNMIGTEKDPITPTTTTISTYLRSSYRHFL